jgi:ATP synthase protein I
MFRAVSAPPRRRSGELLPVVSMQDPDGPDRLRHLGERLDAARRANPPRRAEPEGGADRTILQVALGLGMRFGIELIAAVGVGAGIGWLVDRALGTKPWAMVLFLVLGAAAGIMNSWRAVTGQGSAIGYRRGRTDKKTGEE